MEVSLSTGMTTYSYVSARKQFCKGGETRVDYGESQLKKRLKTKTQTLSYFNDLQPTKHSSTSMTAFNRKDDKVSTRSVRFSNKMDNVESNKKRVASMMARTYS